MNTENPRQRGLYDPANEHDACGVGLVINIDGAKSHQIVENGLRVLENMQHRGAEGADNKTGDGAGILVQIPHEFILLQGIPLPEKGRYGVGMVFLPKERATATLCLDVADKALGELGLELMHTREVPVDSTILGEAARATEPRIVQIFVRPTDNADNLERRLYTARRHIEKRLEAAMPDQPNAMYFSSLSTSTLIYKGMLTSMQLREYFLDLTNPYFTSGLALVHSRFSTNTFPTWALAQPFRLLGHNGEINTIKGNRSWLGAHESVLYPEGLGDMSEMTPIIQPAMSDSASLDNALEFFVQSGMSLPHALAMLIPESYNARNPISDDLKAFYEYHSIWMEPWDGPATLMFSDGRYAGGMLDRNGLRPARYLVTRAGMMVVASETGVLDIPAAEIREKGRLRPGKILLVDTLEGKVHYDAEVKEELANAHPYREWLEKNRIRLGALRSGRKVRNDVDNYGRLLRTFGYSKEDVERIILPMGDTGAEPTASMGNDTPLAVLSAKPQRLFNYFRQQFAQVTNPPIDPIREELVMSLSSHIGAVEGNVLEPTPELAKVVKLNSPVLTNTELDILKNLRYKGFNTRTLDMTYNVSAGARGIEEAIDRLCAESEKAVDDGCNYVVLSDRGVSATQAPVPSLMAVAAVHQYLTERHKRAQIALIVETGEAREVMHIALLTGYGVSGINPYMVFAILDSLTKKGELQLDYETAEKHYIKAINKGMLKVMSKMGISTIRSYRGARIFESLGLSQELLDKYFQGSPSVIEGAGLSDIAAETAAAHAAGFAAADTEEDEYLLDHNGIYAFRKTGEKHAWNPATISTLQLATRLGSYKKYKEFAAMVDDKEWPWFLRDMMLVKTGKAIDISEVEPVEAITRRFVTGAMSFGSISREAHEAMALAMNAIGGRSNTGEGGEDPARFTPREDGSSTRSAIKQVASGRFGVTTEYLVNADEIQIKVAQGAKPGEGGQLPGFKVDEMIARTRHSIPGISLISPPPHHDIYSIEDLAQLIFDLKNVNPSARISVKLVSETGVGTIAAGVAKAKADMILISGAEGGTGASPASSIKHAGLPWEIGLADTQQTLVRNNLRGQIVLQADGQLKTGRDIIVAALMGAEEYGFATSALIVLGCVMMRKCHLNTCPVGVATQSEELRRHFVGRSEYLVNFFRFLAEDVREHLAEMGFRSLDEVIGHAELLSQAPAPKLTDMAGEWDRIAIHKIEGVDLSKVLYVPAEAAVNALRHSTEQLHALDGVLDRKLVGLATQAIESGKPVKLEFPIKNTDRAVGAMLSGAVTKKYGGEGLPDDTINVKFRGSAGQSFGAFLCSGITFELEGDSNDYLGKGLSGGRIVVKPADGTEFAPEANIIAGNTLLYGATSGEVFINGRVGERFCVRNSGATAVVEGVGDHCCEYMTGGVTVVLGTTGRNFAAGMSGGVAYVWNPEGTFDYFCNMEMVELSLIEEIADSRELKGLVTRHLAATGSPLAARMLENWAEYEEQFIKVMPIEYKKVLKIRKMEALERKIASVERDY
ncbi:MAG: glutamate synthase large subunit [Rikenellaceae bacterium]|jgi:glutamate synthase (NADPH/NADH) large chain|nr:glutamate synthase large subunit [Rikenellaceae bacterium]